MSLRARGTSAGRVGNPSASRRAVPSAVRALALAAHVAACAVFACAVFFALLSLWGLAVAPFVRLSSASFVIVCALVASGAATVVAYGAFRRRLERRRKRGAGGQDAPARAKARTGAGSPPLRLPRAGGR